MSNFAIDININAPALVGALEHLCTALGKPVMLEAKMAGTAAKPETVPQPVQTAPVAPAPYRPQHRRHRLPHRQQHRPSRPTPWTRSPRPPVTS